MSERRQGPPPRGVIVPGAAKGAGKSFVRLLSYMKRYWIQLILVFVCILVSAVAGVAGSTFLQTLIDDYISPMLLNGSRDFFGLAGALAKLGVLYAAGILGTLFYNRLMVVVAQGILKTIRDEMFSHMQTLPIRFFDTHASGDVMSLYTNDTDTLRQMLAQSIPQIFSSIVTVIAVFVAMVRLSIWLTLFVLAFVALMMLVTKFVGGKSGCFLCEAAELHWCGKRLYRGNDSRTESHQGVLPRGTDQGGLRQAQRRIVPERRMGEQLRQYPYADHEQSGLCPVCVVGNAGRCVGVPRRRRSDTGRNCRVPAIEPQLHHADQPDLPAGQCDRHGTGRSRTHHRTAGRGAGNR